MGLASRRFPAYISAKPGEPYGERAAPEHLEGTRAQGALALHLDDPQRQSPARQRGRDEDRRAPGVLRLPLHDPDGAVFRGAAAGGPGGGEAPCSPIYHAIQYLFGRQTREKLENFRGYKGAQSYPSRTKDIDDVDFSTGSVGLGVAQTLFASLVQDYVKAHGWAKDRPEGRMISLVGDAEMDEGNIFEALLEGWKHGIRNTWWIIDYNRQSLDAVIREGL